MSLRLLLSGKAPGAPGSPASPASPALPLGLSDCSWGVASCLLSDSQKVSLSQGCSCCRPRTPWPGEQGPGPAKAEPAGGWPTHFCTILPFRPSGRGPCQGPRSMEPSPESGEAAVSLSGLKCSASSQPTPSHLPQHPASLPGLSRSLWLPMTSPRALHRPPAPDARGRCGRVQVCSQPNSDLTLRRTLVGPLGLGKLVRALGEVI